jgi:Flp pilus assembly protein TadG
MSKESTAMNRFRAQRHEGERGQILVLFVIAIVVIIGMLGLVLDGGSAFAQRRDEQNVADLAAVAGADAYLSSTSNPVADANAAATAIAQKNGYVTNAAAGVVVDVVVTPGVGGASVTVNVTKPHQNNFSTILGMPTWGVSAHATAQASAHANGVMGAMPLLFNEAAFPGAICDEQLAGDGCASKIEVYQLPGSGNQDVPQDATQFNWTVFCTANGNACNGDTTTVTNLMDSNGTDTVIYIDDKIGPLDAGNHTDLLKDTGPLVPHIGETFPVPIVDNAGNMVGWAYFKLTSVEGAPDKVIKGYFVAPYVGKELVVNNNHATGTLNTGTYLLRLSD